MPTRSPLAAVALLAIAAPVVAAEPEAGPADETMVVARTVMPRIAYRALEPTANPVRVEATTFPGRVFHGAIDGLVGQLVGDDQLGERAAAPIASGGRELPTHHAPLMDGPGLQGPGASTAPLGRGASIGGAVLRATSGIGSMVQDAVRRTGGGG
jgi:hypothetical protein